MGNDLTMEILNWAMMAGLGVLVPALLYIIYIVCMSYIDGPEKKQSAKPKAGIRRKK